MDPREVLKIIKNNFFRTLWHRPSLGLSRLSPRAKPTQQRAIFNLLGTSGWNQVGPKSNSKAVGRGGATGGAHPGSAQPQIQEGPVWTKKKNIFIYIYTRS